MYKTLKKKLEKAEWSNEDIWELVLAFDKLTKYWAQKYQWNGVEFDDLYQIGRITMFYLIRQCRYRELLMAYIARSLPGKIKDAANALRWRKESVSFDANISEEDDRTFGETLVIFDPEAVREFERAELEAMLRTVLSGEPLSLAESLLDGESRRDAAERMGISRQAVEKRMKKIGEILRQVL